MGYFENEKYYCLRIISLCLVFVISIITVNSTYAESRMNTTLEVTDGISLQDDRDKIITFIQSKEIQKKMISMGIEPQEAVARVVILELEAS